jgi:hypothetical protein
MKTLLIILLVILSVRWLIKLLTPYIITQFLKQVTNRQFGTSSSSAKKESKVNVADQTATGKKIDKNVGEYVEFEEMQ